MIGRVRLPHIEQFVLKPRILTNPEEFIISTIYPTNFRDFITDMVEQEVAFIVNGEVALARNIDCNYIKKKIYVKYIKNTYIDVPDKYIDTFMANKLYEKYHGIRFGYNQEVGTSMIWDNGKFVENIFIISLKDDNIGIICANTENMKIEESNVSKNAEDLFNKYIAMSYGYLDENDYHLYHSNAVLSAEKKILKYYGVKHLGDYHEISYLDVRNLDIKELREKFDNSILKIEKSYNLRKIDFELDILIGCYLKRYWSNWSKGSIENIIGGKEYFCKFKKHGFALVFKDSWL